MCSTERMPAPVARSTSATVWSRWRSTKWWCQSSGPPSCPGTSQSWRVGADGRRRRRARTARRRIGEAGGDGRRGSGGDALGEAVVEVEAAAAGAGDLLVGDRRCRARKRRGRRPSAACPGAGSAGGPRGSSRRRRPAGRRRALDAEVSSPSSLMLRTVTPRDAAPSPRGVGDGAADQHPRAAAAAAAAVALSCGRASTTAATPMPAARRSAARA